MCSFRIYVGFTLYLGLTPTLQALHVYTVLLIPWVQGTETGQGLGNSCDPLILTSTGEREWIPAEAAKALGLGDVDENQ